MAESGNDADPLPDDDFPSMALFGEGITKTWDMETYKKSPLYLDVPEIETDDLEELKEYTEEEENPYMSLKNCVIDLFKADMSDMLKSFNIMEITNKVDEIRPPPLPLRPRTTSMRTGSVYHRQKSKDEREEETVNVLVVRNLDVYKVAFVKASPKYREELDDLMKAQEAEVLWKETEEDRVKLTEIKPQRNSTEQDVQVWREQTESSLKVFFKPIMVRKITMFKKVWAKIKDNNSLSSISSVDQDKVAIFPSEELPGVIIVGDILAVSQVSEAVLQLVKNEEEFDIKKSITQRSSIDEMQTWMLRYLTAIDITVKLSAKYKNMVVFINMGKKTIEITGQGVDVTKAKFDIQQILNVVESRVVENLNKHILQAYTMDEIHEYIQDLLRQKQIQAAFEVVSDELWIFAENGRKLDEAQGVIKDALKLRYLKTDGLSLDAWQMVLKSLSQTTDAPFYIDAVEQRAILVCGATVEDLIMKKLREASKESALEIQKLRLEKGIFLVLERRRQTETDAIKSKFDVDMSFDHASCTVAIRGPAAKVCGAVEELKRLSDDVIEDNLDLSSPGAFVFCQSVKGDSLMKQVEEEFQCVMDVEAGDLNEDDRPCEHTLGASVNIVKGNLHYQLVDVIVNSVGRDLNLSSSTNGQALINAAGSSIQKQLKRRYPGGLRHGEIAVTSGGNLRCKSIFHCCIPHWKPDPIVTETYQQVIKQCLDEADVSNYSSMAFPALGCGQRGFPPPTAAKAFLDAIVSYERTTNSGIKEINVVVIDSQNPTFLAFENERNKRITGTEDTNDYLKDDTDDPNLPVAGIRIVVQVGELADTKADVLVNTTNQQLDLSHGAVSSSLLKAAGSSIQKECREHYRVGILPGEVAVTGGGALRCKKIYHCTLPKWMKNPDAPETLNRIIDTCLEKASGAGYETIAFPALGTGAMMYPADVIASKFKDRVAVFSMDNPLCCLREVLIILYHKDTLTCKAFSDVFEQDPELKKEACSPDEQSAEEFQFGKLHLEVKQADLLQEPVDAIVIPTDNRISLTDAFGKLLIKHCGHSLMQETQRAKITRSGSVLISAKNLPCRYIMFVSTEYFKNNMDNIVNKCFRKADKNKIRTIAFPHINAAIDTDAAAFSAAIVKSVGQYKVLAKHLRGINTVMTSQQPLTACIFALRQNFHKNSLRWSFAISESKDEARKRMSFYSSKSVVVSVSDGPHLRMLGTCKEAVLKCRERMKRIISENIADKTLDRPALKTMTKQKVDEIESFCESIDVLINLDQTKGQVRLQGARDDVTAAEKHIAEVIEKTEYLNSKQEIARNIQTSIQWYYIAPISENSDPRCPFTSVSNMFIEQAYSEGRDKLPLHLPEQTVVLDFKKMAMSLSGSQTVKIVREERQATRL